MPELPEVETVVRRLRPLWDGRRIDRVVVRRPRLRLPVPPDLAARLEGAVIASLARRGKYGLVATDRADVLLFHLGMSGSFQQLEGEPGRHDHLLFAVGGRTFAFHDPRRFGFVDLVRAAALAADPRLAALGPEPLSPAFTAATLTAHSRGLRPVKALLLDQHVVAGLGNIYALEALFAAGIHPATPVAVLTAGQRRELVAAIRAVLQQAIAAGGSTLRDHQLPDGGHGWFQQRFHVYGREGEPCTKCGAPIARIVQSGRSSFFCPVCQPPPEAPAGDASGPPSDS